MEDLDVTRALEKAFLTEAPLAKAPVLLRLVFHDAGTFCASSGDGGLNASIRLELDRPENFGLKRGWSVLERVRSRLKDSPAEDVSWADLVAFGGAHAVALCGGPRMTIRYGRLDATKQDPHDRLPAEDLSAAALKDNFHAKGLSTQEFVALSGAHTLGSKGFGDPTTFDNEYYRQLLLKPWADNKNEMASMIGLASDHAVADDAECLPWIRRYSEDQQAFFNDFSSAYIKLVGLGATYA